MTNSMTLAEYRRLIARERRPRGGNPESQITWSIIEYLTAVGIAAARTQAGEVELKQGGYMRLGPEGWPDISGTLPGGRSCYVETKTSDGVLSQAQEAMHEWLRSLGALVIVATSIDDVRAALKAEGIVTREVS